MPDPEALLLVASDRVSAFDVVMNEAVPFKGAVLTQLSAFWFRHLGAGGPFPLHHRVTPTRSSSGCPGSPDTASSSAVARCWCGARAGAVRVRRARVPQRVGLEGVPGGGHPRRGAAAEGDARERAPGRRALLARHQGGVGTRHQRDLSHWRRRWARTSPAASDRSASPVYSAGRDYAAGRGIIIADTKFEFGRHRRHPAADR